MKGENQVIGLAWLYIFMSDTRMPTQKRSIEKRNKIIEKGFELMCENGYYKTTTSDIAKYIGISTGIIYQYFNDKKEIFLEGVKYYSDAILFPMLKILDENTISMENIDDIVKSIIDDLIKQHTFSKKAHEELMAMSHLDSDISEIFKNSELELTKKIVTILDDNGIHLTNAEEKIHIAIGVIDNLCHEIAYHQHEEFDYEVMKNETVK